jgi:hypothetical protein
MASHSAFCGKLILNINYETVKFGVHYLARGWELGTRGDACTVQSAPLRCVDNAMYETESYDAYDVDSLCFVTHIAQR